MTKDELKALTQDLSKLAKARGCTGVVVSLSASDGTDLNYYVEYSAGFEALFIAHAAVCMVQGKPLTSAVLEAHVAGGGSGGEGHPHSPGVGGAGAHDPYAIFR